MLGGRELRFLSIYAPFLCVMALALGTFFYLLDAPDLQQLLPILGLLAGTMLLSGVISWNFATTLYTKEKDLRENRMLRESFMEKTQSGLFVKDIEGRFLYANDVWCRMLNSSNQAVEGKTDFDFFPREQAQLLQQQDAAVVANGDRIEFDFTLIEKRYVRPLETWSAYGHNEQGHLVKFLTKHEELCATGRIRARIRKHEVDSYHNGAKVTSLNFVKAA